MKPLSSYAFMIASLFAPFLYAWKNGYVIVKHRSLTNYFRNGGQTVNRLLIKVNTAAFDLQTMEDAKGKHNWTLY